MKRYTNTVLFLVFIALNSNASSLTRDYLSCMVYMDSTLLQYNLLMGIRKDKLENEDGVAYPSDVQVQEVTNIPTNATQSIRGLNIKVEGRPFYRLALSQVAGKAEARQYVCPQLSYSACNSNGNCSYGDFKCEPSSADPFSANSNWSPADMRADGIPALKQLAKGPWVILKVLDVLDPETQRSFGKLEFSCWHDGTEIE